MPEISPMTSPLLFHAQQAVDYVKSVIYVAGNRALDVAATGGGSYVCVSARRLFNPDDETLPKLVRIHRWAESAEASHCGNCGEQSAVAFVFLEKNRTLRPLEFMYFAAPYDHNYVVLGRPQASDVRDPKTWGKTAVVCDPWKGMAYSAAELSKVWPDHVPECFFPLL